MTPHEILLVLTTLPDADTAARIARQLVDHPEQVVVRIGGGHRFPVVPSQQVSYMDVSPKQVVSVGTALIPFMTSGE